MTAKAAKDAPIPVYSVGERSINEIIHDLAQPISPALLKSKRVGGTELTFIPWYNATRLLDLYAPGWEYTVSNIQQFLISSFNETSGEMESHNKIALVATISIPTKDGIITRQATGNEDDVTNSYGDAFSNAESMALRRAAAKFGLGRYLYNKK